MGSPLDDQFFVLLAAVATCVALMMVGMSGAIIVRMCRLHRANRLMHVMPLAIFANMLALRFVYRFWTGAYNPGIPSDSLYLLVAYSFGCFGLWWLLRNPLAKIQ